MGNILISKKRIFSCNKCILVRFMGKSVCITYKDGYRNKLQWINRLNYNRYKTSKTAVI